MPRPRTGKIHVGERQEKRKNGDIYVYERVTKYNPETKKTVTVSEKLKGKILAGTKEIIPTRPKRSQKESSETAIRKKTGLTDILEYVGKESNIDNDIHKSFSKGDAEKITSIARYLVATGGQSLTRLESWQVMHETPYVSGISEDVYSKLFKEVGVNENGMQSYFACRAKSLDTNPVIAYDSTTISTYSENQIEARQGFNKDHDGLNTIKLLTLYSVKDHEPIAFTKQPGNVPDVISIQNALKQIKCFDVKKPLIVTDNGYYSYDNMAEFFKRNMKFLTLANTDISWIKTAIDEVKDKINLASSICPFDPTIRGVTTTVTRKFKIKKKNKNKDSAEEEFETITRKLYVHIFHSFDNAMKKRVLFDSNLLALKSDLENGKDDFSDAAKKKIEKLFIIKKSKKSGKVKVEFNEEAIATEYQYLGYFVLVTNQAMGTFEALSNYRLRERIEEGYGDHKSSLGGSRPHTWFPDNLKGKLFVQFIALGYLSFLQKKIKEVKESLAKNPNEMTKEQYSKEEKLSRWLKEHSLLQIMDWFDCIETTTVQTANSKIRWSTESVSRDNFFLEKLGVLKK